MPQKNPGRISLISGVLLFVLSPPFWTRLGAAKVELRGCHADGIDCIA